VKLFLDCRMLFAAGIGRYIQNILTYLPSLIEDLELTLAGNCEQICKFIDKWPFLNRKVKKIVNFITPIYGFGEQAIGSLLFQKHHYNIDLFHCPHYNAPWLLPEASVVTVHDLIHFRFPQYHNKVKVRIAKAILDNALKKTSKVISISKSTTNDLIDMFPEINFKITTVYQGVADFFQPCAIKEVEDFKIKRGLKKYILYVGNRKPHKNLARLIRAYIIIYKVFPDIQLVIVGKKFDQKDEISSFKQEIDLSYIVEIEEATDQDLLYLYCGAEVLVLPSLYEGFGVPPLEAMACGTPVIVSKVASLSDVVGDAGIYVDPYSVEDIAKGIYHVLTDQNLREYLRKKGFGRVKNFTWEKTAKKTLEVYQEVLQKQGRKIY